MACSGTFGTPGWVRTSGLSLRRRPLYPTELRGLIQKIFNFEGLQGSNGSIVRRAVLYPAELLARMQFLFASVTPAIETPPNVRRRSLYTTELQGHMQNYSIVQFRWTRDRRMLGGVCYIHLTKEACRCIVAQVFHTVKRALPRQEPGKGLKASPHNCVCGLRPIFCPIRAVIKGGNTYSIPALL